MRVHPLNCISSCPLGGRLMDGRTCTTFTRGRLCWLLNDVFSAPDISEFERLSGRSARLPATAFAGAAMPTA